MSTTAKGKAVSKKRVVIISDMHCGNLYGLTPPYWHDKVDDPDLAVMQGELWRWYAKTIDTLRPIDALIVNADCVDGRGERAGSVETLRLNRRDQCDMAADVINYVRAPNIGMTYGTPYHTGKIEDWEKDIAKDVQADKIGGHEWFTIGGVCFDCKHKIGSSSIPHGRFTAVAKERLWNALWAERGNNPTGDVIIRSHVHYFGYCGGSDWMAITTPALQAQGTRYGVRECSGLVDFGLLWFDVQDGEILDWKPELAPIEIQATEAFELCPDGPEIR